MPVPEVRIAESMLVTARSMSNFQKNTISIAPVASTTCLDAGEVVINLPQNAILDLHDFALRFQLNFTVPATKSVQLPQSTWDLVERLEVYINGQSVSDIGDCGLPKLLNRIYTNDLTGKEKKKAFEFGERKTYATGTYALQLALTEFPNIFSSAMRFWPMNIFGNVEIRLKWKALNTIADMTDAASDPTSVSYSSIRAVVPVIQFADNSYIDLLSKRLSNSPLYIPFKRYIVQNASAFNGSTSFPVSIATQSLDKVFVVNRAFTYADSKKTLVAVTTDTFKDVLYYVCPYGTNQTTSVTINGVAYPQASIRNSADALMGVYEAHDLLSHNGNGSYISALSDFETWGGAACIGLNHIDPTVSSGMNTYGSVQTMTVDISGAGNALTPTVVFETTALLTVEAGQVVGMKP